MTRSSYSLAGALVLALLFTASSRGQVTPDDVVDDARRNSRDRLDKEAEDRRARAAVLRFQDLAKETSSLLGRLETEASQFSKFVDGLLTNDDGKRLATDPIASMGFLRVFERPIVASSDVLSRKREVDTILTGLQRILDQPSVGYTPPETQKHDVDAHYFWAQERLARIKEERSWLEASIKRLPRDTDLKDVPTMKQAIDQFMLKRIDLWSESRLAGVEAAKGDAGKIVYDAARIAELERARAEAERLLREERRKIEQLRIDFEVRLKQELAVEKERVAEAEIELQNRLAELDRLKKEAEAERKAKDLESKLARDQKVEDAEKPLLVKRCQDPETRTILAPFLDKGMVRPSGNRGTRFYDTIEPVPVSLKDLYACGALDQTPEGLDKLYWATIDPQDTMRTRWRRSQQWRTTPALREKLVNAQKLLIELGPTLVELEMLQE